MRDRGATCAVVECSSEAMLANRCQFLELSVAVHTDITNIDVEDDELREQLREAQLSAFDSLVDSTSQASVINLDDLFHPLVKDHTGLMPIVTYSYSNKSADVYIESAKFSVFESEVIVVTPEGKLQIITPLLGR